MMISYAQNFEDVMLWRALKDVRSGAYIDIGACDPVADSVSLHFYKNGWRGLHVEPVPSYANALRTARPDETVIEAAVSASNAEVKIYTFEGTGLSTALAPFAEQHEKEGRPSRTVTANCVTLASIFETFNRSQIHWLKIDVEGMELDVLDSWGDHPARPWIVVVESTLPNSQETNHHTWEHHLNQRDYAFVYFDGLNRFYLHESQSRRQSGFDIAPNVFDRFTVAEQTPLGSGLGAELKGAQAKCEALSGQIATMSNEVEIREAELVRLRTEFGVRSASLANEIEIREAELVRVRGVIEELTQRLSAAGGEIVQRDAEITRLHIAVQERTSSFHETLTAQTKAFDAAVESVRVVTTSAYERRLSDVQDRAAEVEAEFQARFSDLQASLLESGRIAGHWQTNSQALQAEINITAQKLAVAFDDAAHWRRELEASEERLNAIRSSTSWKVSAPLRWSKETARYGLAFSRSLARPVLNLLLNTIRANPWMKPPILAAARLFPRVDRKLSAFVGLRPAHRKDEVMRGKQWNVTPDVAQVSEWMRLLGRTQRRSR